MRSGGLGLVVVFDVVIQEILSRKKALVSRLSVNNGALKIARKTYVIPVSTAHLEASGPRGSRVEGSAIADDVGKGIAALPMAGAQSPVAVHGV